MKKVNIFDINEIYESLSKNIKNKNSLYLFEKNKMIYLNHIKETLNSSYDGGKYNIFLLKYPKKRIIMSQSIIDKIINHYVTKHILEEKLKKYLDKRNVATRKNMGTSYGIKLFMQYINKLKFEYDDIYVLKLDIKNYFPSIDHCELKKLLVDKLDSFEYGIIENIIDSTNHSYVNDKIVKINEKNNLNLPLYDNGKGLPIGNMTSQFLAIFYLHEFHHYLIHKQKLKYFVNYMDDYVIICPDKDYLSRCKKEIINFLSTYKLEINENKTRINHISNGVNFLGYKFIMKDNNRLIVKLSSKSRQNIKYNLKKRKYEYKTNEIDINSYFSTTMTYKYGFKFSKSNKVKKIIKKYG